MTNFLESEYWQLGLMFLGQVFFMVHFFQLLLHFFL